MAGSRTTGFVYPGIRSSTRDNIALNTLNRVTDHSVRRQRLFSQMRPCSCDLTTCSESPSCSSIDGTFHGVEDAPIPNTMLTPKVLNDRFNELARFAIRCLAAAVRRKEEETPRIDWESETVAVLGFCLA